MTNAVKSYVSMLFSKYNKTQLNRKETAEILGISLSSLETLINKDQLPIRYKRIGNTQKARYIFPILEIANFLAFEAA